MTPDPKSLCPARDPQDQRKSWAVAEAHLRPESGAQVIGDFSAAREILRDTRAKQAGSDIDQMDLSDPDKVNMFFLDGEPHRRRRAAVARFFSWKAIDTVYRPVIERTTALLMSPLHTEGRIKLEQASFRLAVAVVAEILGLDHSDLAGLSSRIEDSVSPVGNYPIRSHDDPLVIKFFDTDVKPAIMLRQENPKEDVISNLVEEGFSDSAILSEVLAYSIAGMLTTREFIVMAAWHMLENDALRGRFIAGDENEQLAILEEILRLEPLTGMVHRRLQPSDSSPHIEAESRSPVLAIDIRAANTDERITGPCPYMIDPDRAKRMKTIGSLMSFGDGPHRCPGALLSMVESMIFLRTLLSVPGVRLGRAPEIGWFVPNKGYVLRGAIVERE